jgi:hypothetical protein
MIDQRSILLQLQKELSTPSEDTQLRIEVLSDTISWGRSMLEKEKEMIVDFAYKYGDETLREISDIYEKLYNTNEK